MLTRPTCVGVGAGAGAGTSAGAGISIGARAFCRIWAIRRMDPGTSARQNAQIRQNAQRSGPSAVPERIAKSVPGFLPVVAYLAAGIVTASGGGSDGLLPAATGCLLAILSAILVSRVVLVEVLR